MENENLLNGLDGEVKLSDDVGLSDVDNEVKKTGLSNEELDKLTKEEKDEYDQLISWPEETIREYPVEKRVEILKKYNLEDDNLYFKNIVENGGEYKGQINTYSELKSEILGVLSKDDIQNETEKLIKRVCIKEREYIGILTGCLSVRDRGYKILEDDGLYYTYFMSLEHCREYVFEGLGYLQIYGKDGLYNVNSKMVDGYRKSKDILKRIKIIQIKTVNGKEKCTFESLDKFYFIDDRNKNHKLTWNPNKDKIYTENKVDYFNEYTPIKYQGVDHGKDLSLIYYHIKHYLCSDNEEVYHYFISVISDMIRNPGRKLPICIVMNGEGGVGKSFLFDKLFRHLFGDMYGVRSNKISGKFNRELENKICFLIEELSHQDNKNESNIIKDMISNPKIRIERKGIDSYEVENCIRFFICSNGDWSIRIENNNSSRRYLVCDVSTEIPEPEHFNKLSELIKGDKRKGYEVGKTLTETIEQFIFDMNKIDISVLESDPPETESKKISQSFSKGIPEKQLETFFEKVISSDGYYTNFNNSVKIMDENDEYEIQSKFFWDCFTEHLKDRRQQIPEGFNHYGRILSKWFGKDFVKRDTKVVNGRRGHIFTFPKLETVEDILKIE
jgi:hypothetical protein